MLPPVFAADETALLLRIAPHIDDAMLCMIAAGDRGRDQDAHAQILRRMRDADVVPDARWEPLEVLSLGQWYAPGDDPEDHWIRAFCCAWMLRIAISKDPQAAINPHVSATSLVLSLARLGINFWDEAGALLAWIIASAPDKGMGPETAFLGIVMLRCALGADSVADDQVIALCEWVADREQREPRAWALDDRWLLRIQHDKETREAGRTLALELQGLDISDRSSEVCTWVRLIASLLAEPK
ncbi:hypothetical protein [Sphingomonas radiodurans]|uniref:hypothetical protein n=1 Tax=Sphingomonas radiodurans TaxID=2890321 RepID=UPI001E4BEE79|nr:hypothetical protein [Sphingomonas radiodurans]WBH15854.1 hypothetical protein LLW23_13715 [Sphingomonas radiodurans]